MRKPFISLAFLLVLLILCISATTPSANDLWPKEPNSFKGVPFGASLQEARKILHLDQTPNARDCDVYEPTGDGVCRDYFRIGDALLKARYKFVENRLVSISIDLASSDYDYLKEIFIEKYGIPSQVGHTAVSTAVGANYNNETLTWLGIKLVLQMENYTNTAEEGSILFILVDEIEKRKKEREKGKKDALKDF